jgi:hypothetical protein
MSAREWIAPHFVKVSPRAEDSNARYKLLFRKRL